MHGALLVALYLSPIQYFIIPGVSRLKRSDGWWILTIRHTVHWVHTAKGQRFFLILSIDWKIDLKSKLYYKKSSGRELCRGVKAKGK